MATQRTKAGDHDWTDEDEAWFQDYLKKRDQRYGGQSGLWESNKRGAAALGGYGSSSYGNAGASSENWELIETLRFATSMAEIVAGDVKGARWSTGDLAESASRENRSLVLDPAPVKRIGKPGFTRDDARTVAAGQAIHDAGHLRRTAPGMRDRLSEHPRIRGERIPKAITDAAMSLVEDAHVEADVLAQFPGYISYLDDHWRHKKPEDELTKDITKGANDGPTAAAGLFEVIQDRSRRYTEVPERQRAAIAALPEEKRRYLEAAARILRRAHDPAIPAERRIDLAADLARLLLRGEVAPEDRPALGPRAWSPNKDQELTLDDHVVQQRNNGKLDGNLTGSKEALPTSQANQVQQAIDDDAREEVVEIVTATGNAQVKVGLIDLPPKPVESQRAAARIARYIPPLAAKLKFRAVKPQRHIGAQLRGRLEDQRIVEFPLAMATGRQPRAYSRTEILSAPRAGVGLLVDMSGSMGAAMASREFGTIRRSEAAKLAAAMAYGALARVKRESQGEVDFAMWGHTTAYGTGFSRDVGCAIYRIVGPRIPGPERVGAIFAGGGNYDGPALAATAEQMKKAWPDRERVLLFINDGLPNGHEYGGSPAMEAIRDHCNFLRKRGTEVITIYLGEENPGRGVNGVPHEALALMYGPLGTGYTVCADLGDLPHMVGKILTKVLKWQA